MEVSSSQRATGLTVAFVGCQYSVPHILQGLNRERDLTNIFQRAVRATVLGHQLMQASPLVHVLNPDHPIECQWEAVHPTQDYDAVRHRLLVRQLNTGFTSANGPAGWRIKVLRRRLSDAFEAFFIFDSVKFDGMSGIIFHQEVRYYLNVYSRQCHDPERRIPPRGSIYPGPGLSGNIKTALAVSESTFPSKYSFSKVLNKCAAILNPSPVQSVDPDEAKTGLKTVIIPHRVASEVLNVCRYRDMTITPLLQAITTVSLARQSQMPPTGNRMGPSQSLTTIDPRPYIANPVPASLVGDQIRPEEPAKTMMNVVGQVVHTISPDQVAKIRVEAESWNAEANNPTDEQRASILSLNDSRSTHTVWPSLDAFTTKPPRQSGGQPEGPELKARIWGEAKIVRQNVMYNRKRFEYDVLELCDKGTSRLPHEEAVFQVNNLLTMDGVDPIMVGEAEELARLAEERERANSAENYTYSPIGLPPAPAQAPWMNKNLCIPSAGATLYEPGFSPHRKLSPNRHRSNKRNGIVFKDWDAELGKSVSPDCDSSPTTDSKFSMVKMGEIAKEQQERKKEEELNDNITTKTFHIQRANFAVSPRGTGSPIHLSVLTVTGGDMVIEMTYRQGIIDEDVIETVAKGLQGWLPWISKGKDLPVDVPLELQTVPQPEQARGWERPQASDQSDDRESGSYPVATHSRGRKRGRS